MIRSVSTTMLVHGKHLVGKTINSKVLKSHSTLAPLKLPEAKIQDEETKDEPESMIANGKQIKTQQQLPVLQPQASSNFFATTSKQSLTSLPGHDQASQANVIERIGLF